MVQPPVITGLTGITLAWGPDAATTTMACGAVGLALVIRATASGDLAYDVVLRFPNGRGDRPIVSDVDEVDVVAEWRRIAGELGQRLLIQAPDGGVVEPYTQMGRVFRGATWERRRCWALTKHRPLFLRRRKTGRLPERPVVLRGTELAPRV